MPTDLIQASLFHIPAVVAESAGVPLDAVLAAAGLDALPPMDSEARLPLSSFVAAVRCVLERVDGPSAVFVAMQHFPVEALGLPGFILRSCPDVAAALQRLSAHQHLLGEGRYGAVRAVDERVVIEFFLPPTAGGHAPETFAIRLTIAVTILRLLTRSTLAPVEASLPRLPDASDVWAGYLWCPLEQRAGAARLVIGPDELRLPIAEGREDMLAFFEAEARRRFPTRAPAADARTVGDALRARLRARGLWQVPDADELARELGLSRRSLFRRLRFEGTSVKEIREELQRADAERLLRETDHDHGTIAVLVGFSGGRAFARAFRRWTGQSPTQWRAQVGDGL